MRNSAEIVILERFLKINVLKNATVEQQQSFIQAPEISLMFGSRASNTFEEVCNQSLQCSLVFGRRACRDAARDQ